MPKILKKIAIYGEHYKNIDRQYFELLIDALASYNVSIHIAESFVKILRKLQVEITSFSIFNNGDELDESFDLMFTLGGDGTILSALTYIKDKKIPILGINTGRLGFLAGVQKQEIKKAVDALFKGLYQISKRCLLKIITPKKTIGFPYAMNECVISRGETNSMIGIKAMIGQNYLTTYWADGLIVATPTGCTGYSLSCQGPIVMPAAKNFIINPIAPHNLNARPIVISDDNILHMEITGRVANYQFSLDNRVFKLPKNTKISIKKANFHAHLIQLNDKHFLKTLREKLLWGEDTRNYITE